VGKGSSILRVCSSKEEKRGGGVGFSCGRDREQRERLLDEKGGKERLHAIHLGRRKKRERGYPARTRQGGGMEKKQLAYKPEGEERERSLYEKKGYVSRSCGHGGEGTCFEKKIL